MQQSGKLTERHRPVYRCFQDAHQENNRAGHRSKTQTRPMYSEKQTHSTSITTTDVTSHPELVIGRVVSLAAQAELACNVEIAVLVPLQSFGIEMP